ncbi:MAG TPA: SuhR protein [Thermoanaerobaculia bacterium]
MSTALQDAPSSHPAECDIIMKGGITSGVVYPLAVSELARTYRFRNIGGTSAGAIAAALTAAAELGRSSAGGGFSKLDELPGILRTRLLSLFQPSPGTRPAFEVLLSCMGKGSIAGKGLRGVGKILRLHWFFALLGALLGAGLWFLLVMAPLAADRGRAGTWIVLGVVALVCGVIGAALRFLTGSWRALNGNGFGLCNGFDQVKGQPPPLTPWLADLLNVTAGRDPSGSPLTFGDLWGPGSRDAQEADASQRQINLEVMTTNLTHGWPLRLPFVSHEFFFDPAELGLYFPPSIVQWLIEHPYRPQEADDENLIALLIRQTPFRPLPAPADLPVVVAARMSLSFPGLISAVPLYAVDWSRTKNYDAKKEGRAPDLERCWFSDGGIGSNFPVHFFDGLLPRRPTFGINLRPFHPDHPRDPNDESKNVRFPTATGQGAAPAWTPIPNVLAFATTIVKTMQNWVDNTQMRLPGYRDRVVHVFLDPDEGGMNLNMPPSLIETLMRRGQAAGDKLSGFDWDGHRWTRYLTAMSQLQTKLGGMEGVYASGFRDFLLQHESTQKPYRHPAAWKKFAIAGTDPLMTVVQAWAKDPSGYQYTDDAPRPEPELRIGPKR